MGHHLGIELPVSQRFQLQELSPASLVFRQKHVEHEDGLLEEEMLIFAVDLHPIGSMYGIYGNIYHQYTPNVCVYTIHGSYGHCFINLHYVLVMAII